tara:strand:- start:328 stop:651 length:324 start_codon:yes stop_codon:yes gene_type:complete
LEKRYPGSTALIEDACRSENISRGEIDIDIWALSGIDFGSKVEYSGRLVFLEDPGQQAGLVDVTFNENKSWILVRSDEVASVACRAKAVNQDEALEPLGPEKMTGQC